MLRKFNGALSHQLKHYSLDIIQEQHPGEMAIIVGQNDLSRAAAEQRNTGTEIDVAAIADGIIDVGLNAINQGVKVIYINGLTKRKGMFYDKYRRAINSLLADLCKRENVIYVDHDNIQIQDLHDRVHLDEIGMEIFASNILSAFNNNI